MRNREGEWECGAVNASLPRDENVARRSPSILDVARHISSLFENKRAREE
jgi:hypothetical protein